MTRYLWSILIFVSISSISWCQSESNPKRKDSLMLVHDNFLNNEIFNDLIFQDSLFGPLEGLWTCVSIKNNRTGNTRVPKYSNIYFSDRKVWYLDYPCSWNTMYFEDVHLRSDSIFFSQKERVYIEKNQFKLFGDTLIIFGTNKWDNVKTFVKINFDTKILETLNFNNYNPNCITGVWKLEEFGDGKSDWWDYDSDYLNHIPRKIDFESQEFIISGNFIISTVDENLKFEIIQFDRISEENQVEEWLLVLKDTQEHNGIYHECIYVSKR